MILSTVSGNLTNRLRATNIVFLKALWRNWQTQRIQNPSPLKRVGSSPTKAIPMFIRPEAAGILSEEVIGVERALDTFAGCRCIGSRRWCNLDKCDTTGARSSAGDIGHRNLAMAAARGARA